MKYEIIKRQNGQDTEYVATKDGVTFAAFETPQEAQDAIAEHEQKSLPQPVWGMVKYYARAAIIHYGRKTAIVPFPSTGEVPTQADINLYLNRFLPLGEWVTNEKVEYELASHLLLLGNGQGLYRTEHLLCDAKNQTVYKSGKRRTNYTKPPILRDAEIPLD